MSNIDGLVIPMGPYEVRVGASKSHECPLSVSKGSQLVFCAPETDSWLVGYVDGYALPESRGFFFLKPMKISG